MADLLPFDRVDQLLYDEMGTRLTDLQRLILEECWQAKKKTYEEIANQHNYSSRYLQQRVAPSLWRLLSCAVGEKVTKSNLKQVMLRHFSAQLDGSVTANDVQAVEQGNSLDSLDSLDSEVFSSEYPCESVPLGSKFYIQRSPYEPNCYQEITRPGALIRIKAPRQMGKTSLMNRMINHVQDYPVAVLNFQQTERTILADLNKLLRWLCANLSRQLKLTPALEKYWSDDIGSKMSCTYYLEDLILEQLNQPIIVALEEVGELFDFPTVAQDFFAMLRAWHELAKYDSLWKNLRLIMVQSTETYLPLQINQSPFNVGLEIALDALETEQVKTLAERHGLRLGDTVCDQLMSLVAGHPYLIRLALHHIANGFMAWPDLLEAACTDAGIFRDHLHRHLWHLQQYQELRTSFQQVLAQDGLITLPQTLAFKLRCTGLVALEKNQVRVSCDLYRQYFSDRLT